MRVSRPLRTVLAALALVLATPGVRAASTRIEIGPGATEILPREAEIAQDPARGIEHAVVLVEETEWRERLLGTSQVSYHLRAKILSAEARPLADVELPSSFGKPKIRRWWAHTILPDGRVLELPEDELEEQVLAETREGSLRTLRGALPGVEPGCVIDFGYEVDIVSMTFNRTIVLQRQWPVLEWRYRWLPDRRVSAGMVLGRTEGLDIGMQRGTETILVEGRSLPPVPDEPHMPPEEEVRASVTLYYMHKAEREPDNYWRSTAKRLERRVRQFNAGSRAAREVLAELALPAEADLDTRLRRVYDWIQENVRNTGLLTAEQLELGDDDDEEKRKRDTDTWVLEHREGSPRQLDLLFLGLARELGAQAELVLTVDRRRGYWRKLYMDWRQFDGSVVAVRAAGDGIERATFVDAGSGLPYGQVPWYFSGVYGVMVTSSGHRQVGVPLPDTSAAVTRNEASVEFAEDNATAALTVRRSYSAQAGLLWRRALRRLDPQERQNLLYRLCGESNKLAIERAEAPDLEAPAGELRLECEGELLTDGIGTEVGHFTFSIQGLWSPPLPELTPRRRHHPVILDHPEVETTEVAVRAPNGFRPLGPPQPRKIASRFGDYELEVETTDDGYRVSRSFALTQVRVEPADYRRLVEYLDEVRRADAAGLEFERVRD